MKANKNNRMPTSQSESEATRPEAPSKTSIYQRELANKVHNGCVVGNLYVVTRRPIGMAGIVASFETEEARAEWLKGQESRMTPEVAKVLICVNQRFLDHMRDRHHTKEESVLGDVSCFTPAGALIRAVAEWRISQRNTQVSVVNLCQEKSEAEIIRELSDVLLEFLSDQETMNGPFLNEAIYETRTCSARQRQYVSKRVDVKPTSEHKRRDASLILISATGCTQTATYAIGRARVGTARAHSDHAVKHFDIMTTAGVAQASIAELTLEVSRFNRHKAPRERGLVSTAPTFCSFRLFGRGTSGSMRARRAAPPNQTSPFIKPYQGRAGLERQQ